MSNWEQMYYDDSEDKERLCEKALDIANSKSRSIIEWVTFWLNINEIRESDQPSIQETKAKFQNDAALVIPNGISPDVYPENQKEDPADDAPGLAKKFGPKSNIISAKKENLVKFQKKMGLNVDPEAILLY